MVLFFNLVLIVLIAVAGVVVTRWVSEGVVIRQTELILMSQGMILSQAIVDKVEEALGPGIDHYGKTLEEGEYKPTLTREEKETLSQDPVQPRLDPLFSLPISMKDIWEQRVEAQPADDLALSIGQSVIPMLMAARESTLTGIRVVDWQGIVTATTSWGQGKSLIHWPEVALALEGRMASRIYKRGSRHRKTEKESEERRGYRIHVALPLMHERQCLGAVVLIREPLNQSITEFGGIRDYIFIGTIVLLFAVFLFAVLTALTVSLPLGALMRQTERLARGDVESLRPLPNPITREIDMLSKGFVRMARALQDRSDYILTFARELTHAFKPSLATIQMRLEFLDEEEQGELTPEERQRHLTIIKEETARLEKKTGRALEWARADAGRPVGHTTEINRELSEIAEYYLERGLDVRLDLDPKVNRAVISPEDFEKIIFNLVDNSIQHGGPDVRVDLKTALADENAVELRIIDNGPGISEANREKIFKTFFTTVPESGGTGLGLSIVQSLARANDGDIILISGQPGQTQFKINLPRGK